MMLTLEEKYIVVKACLGGWREGSVGKSTSSGSTRTWVWIPSACVRREVCSCRLEFPSRGRYIYRALWSSQLSQKCKLLIQWENLSQSSNARSSAFWLWQEHRKLDTHIQHTHPPQFLTGLVGWLRSKLLAASPDNLSVISRSLMEEGESLRSFPLTFTHVPGHTYKYTHINVMGFIKLILNWKTFLDPKEPTTEKFTESQGIVQESSFPTLGLGCPLSYSFDFETGAHYAVLTNQGLAMWTALNSWRSFCLCLPKARIILMRWSRGSVFLWCVCLLLSLLNAREFIAGQILLLFSQKSTRCPWRKAPFPKGLSRCLRHGSSLYLWLLPLTFILFVSGKLPSHFMIRAFKISNIGSGEIGLWLRVLAAISEDQTLELNTEVRPLTAVCACSSRVSDADFWLLQAQGMCVHTHTRRRREHECKRKREEGWYGVGAWSVVSGTQDAAICSLSSTLSLGVWDKLGIRVRFLFQEGK